jgi:hypothetical protein
MVLILLKKIRVFFFLKNASPNKIGPSPNAVWKTLEPKFAIQLSSNCVYQKKKLTSNCFPKTMSIKYVEHKNVMLTQKMFIRKLSNFCNMSLEVVFN